MVDNTQDKAQVLIYKVGIKAENGQLVHKKAFDIETLYNWIQNKIFAANPLFSDLDENMSIKDFERIVYNNIVMELSDICRKTLGLESSETKSDKKSELNKSQKQQGENNTPNLQQEDNSKTDLLGKQHAEEANSNMDEADSNIDEANSDEDVIIVDE